MSHRTCTPRLGSGSVQLKHVCGKQTAEMTLCVVVCTKGTRICREKSITMANCRTRALAPTPRTVPPNSPHHITSGTNKVVQANILNDTPSTTIFRLAKQHLLRSTSGTIPSLTSPFCILVPSPVLSWQMSRLHACRSTQ